jgi:aminopeptidase N
LQWLEPSQTGDKTLPFLFTQSQAILARTWLPCQDSPGVRFTYAARVKVPPGMMALMSAQNPRERNDSSVYEFYMELPVPSYLMALAVGNIERKDLSERVSVYAEPGMLAAAAAEFADTEKMIQVAESLYGSYAWGRYDMLVLPPSFPFGGMENPRLTFVTPTVVTGDRSLVSLIAHELAHSWSGNLVTNATWNDFWLNEGFTTYFELRIMEAMYGREYSEMLATISHQDMKREVMEFMESEPRQTCLKMHLEGTDPDEGVGAIAYDKGYHFLRLCEETAGRERWDAFVKDYFNEHKFQSTNTEFFLEILTSRLLSESEAKSIGLHEWIYETGLPDNCPVPQSARFAAINSLISNFMEAGAIPDRQVTKEWSTHEWVYFIRGIAGGAPEAAIVELDRTYGLSESKNAEIRAAWIPAALASNPQYGSDDTVFWEATEEFLVNVGRRKFLTPIYKSLILSNNQKRALAIYAKARPNYHSVSRETIDDLLGWKG